MAEKEKVPCGQRGKCTNCERPDQYIADKYGHCFTCKCAVKSLSYGTPEYDAALAKVKKRLNDRGNRGVKNTKKVVTINAMDPKAFEQFAKRNGALKEIASSSPPSPEMTQEHIDSIKQEKDIATSIIDLIEKYSDYHAKQRDYHQLFVDRLMKAKNLMIG